jgi:hypothetical protein
MNKAKRDLLVLFNQTVMSPTAIKYEVQQQLHTLLNQTEKLDNLIKAHEIININNYKISNNYLSLFTFFKSKKEKSFVFLNCKN